MSAKSTIPRSAASSFRRSVSNTASGIRRNSSIWSSFRRSRFSKTPDEQSFVEIERAKICPAFTKFIKKHIKSKRFHDFFDWLKSALKDCVSIIVLIVYALFGTLVYYGLETRTPLRLFDNLNKEMCAGFHGFWGAMHLATTVFTSIGYGNIYPCTAGGRFFTTIYGLFGIPVMFIALDAVGKIMMFVLLFIRRQFHALHDRFCMSHDHVTPIVQLVYFNELHPTLKKQQAEEDEEEDDDVPPSIGVISTIVWIILCLIYFSFIEGWPVLESYYFTMVSLATVGLGEFAPSPSNFYLTLVNFGFIYVGLALISMTINLIQRHIYIYAENMRKEIHRQYKERLEKGGAEGVDLNQFMASARRKAGIMGRLFGGGANEEIEREFEAVSKLVSKFVQATEVMRDSFADGHIETAEAFSQCTPEKIDKPETPPAPSAPLTRSRGIQVDIAMPSLPPTPSMESSDVQSILSAATQGSPMPTPLPMDALNVYEWLLDPQKHTRYWGADERPPWKYWGAERRHSWKPP